MQSLLQLLEACETLNEHERALCVTLLPHLTAEQETRLYGILQREADAIAELEARHSPEAVAIARRDHAAMEKHWQEGESALRGMDIALIENRRFRRENGLAK